VRKLRIGSGAGYGGDRIEPAVDLMERGELDYIGFECLAERTIALAHGQMMKDPSKGYNEFFEWRMEKILPLCAKNRFKVITNMGAANPLAAARVAKKMAEAMGISGLKIAAVVGDDIMDKMSGYLDNEILENGQKLRSIEDDIVSANAYIGARGIVEALRGGADIVIGGRIADPALFLAPMIYEFGWDPSDYERIGKGILAGHLLECSSQVTGGYFADPGYKDVPELWNIGFPIAEVDESGDIVITKLPGTGGIVSADTCKEQIVYEIHDPAKYFTPDGIADYSGVSVEEVGKDRVLVQGASGRGHNGLYKVSVGYKDCFIGEGEISYGGPGAAKRAALAGEIVRRRLEATSVPIDDLRVDLLGLDSLYGESLSGKLRGGSSADPVEVRLRVAGRTAIAADAQIIGNEVEALYLNGPAAGGGARKYVKDILSIASIFIPQGDIEIGVVYEEV
jgi:hypothetical protein